MLELGAYLTDSYMKLGVFGRHPWSTLSTKWHLIFSDRFVVMELSTYVCHSVFSYVL